MIGDLPRSEARVYWEKIQEEVWWMQKDTPLPDFDKVYRVCGGNRFLMERALHFFTTQHCRKSNGDINWDIFPHVQQAYSRLSWAYNPTNRVVHGKSKREDLLTVIERLLKSEGGYLFYEELCAELGDKVVNSLIAHNIIHLWPLSISAFDLDLSGETVITAYSTCNLFAMNKFLQKYNC